jgi:hypothetical protein
MGRNPKKAGSKKKSKSGGGDGGGGSTKKGGSDDEWEEGLTTITGEEEEDEDDEMMDGGGEGGEQGDPNMCVARCGRVSNSLLPNSPEIPSFFGGDLVAFGQPRSISVQRRGSATRGDVSDAR